MLFSNVALALLAAVPAIATFPKPVPVCGTKTQTVGGTKWTTITPPPVTVTRSVCQPCYATTTSTCTNYYYSTNWLTVTSTQQNCVTLTLRPTATTTKWLGTVTRTCCTNGWKRDDGSWPEPTDLAQLTNGDRFRLGLPPAAQGGEEKRWGYPPVNPQPSCTPTTTCVTDWTTKTTTGCAQTKYATTTICSQTKWVVVPTATTVVQTRTATKTQVVQGPPSTITKMPVATTTICPGWYTTTISKKCW
ncbi:uncharacterized protein LOC62_04G005841 [Vanrija pseudolonga]|uniref:Uncharacterized protein n=1 Tax=Vanrija pseudolonga TaxID=143232 RepID=A0AAF1BJ55_9TREE|nr:hypothetical protein LOC62_04G005841 [Vanrija pseudolonga]